MKFLNQKYTRDSLKLALPVMITQLGQVSVNFFDNMIVGKLLGAQALASVSLGNATFFRSSYLRWDSLMQYLHWYPKHTPD